MPIKKVFDPRIRQKKDIIAVKTKWAGIRQIWQWDDRFKCYKRRTEGNKYSVWKLERTGKTTRQVEKAFARLEQAREWRKFVGVGDPPPQQMTLLEVIVKYFKHQSGRIKPTTLETYHVNCKHFNFLNDMYVIEITPKVIDRWFSELKDPQYLKSQHKTRTSYRHDLSLLRQVLGYYGEYIDDCYQMPVKKRHYEDCIIDKEKYLANRQKNKSKYIPKEHVILFLKTLKARSLRLDNPMIDCLYHLASLQVQTGMRIGEVCALSWQNIDLEHGDILVHKTVHWLRGKGQKPIISQITKTGESRTIPLMTNTVRHLKEWKLKCDPRSKLVFAKNNDIIPYRTVQYHYDHAFKEADLPYSSTHILRHSFATLFLESTSDHNALKGILGHKTLKQTEHYGCVTDKLKKDGMLAFEANY